VYDETASELDWLTRVYDILPCASSGNEGPTGMVNSPCTCKNCLCTGGATQNASWIASFTSQGVLDGRTHVPQVAALAVNVTVAQAANPGAPGHADFTLANGTSMASPGICGLAALVDQYFVNATGVRASAAMKMAAVVNSATYALGLVNVDTGQPVVGYHDLSFGVPSLNFAISMYYDKLATSGGSVTRCFAATGTTVSITLAYVDLPAMPFLPNVMVRRTENKLTRQVNVLGMAVIYNGASTVPPMTQNIQKVVMSVLVGATIDVTVFVEGLLSSTNQTFALALTNVQPQTCGILPCTVPHGSGLLLNGGCQVNQCDPNYAIDEGRCLCVASLDCGDGVFVECNMASNEFPPCPGGTIIIVETDTIATPALVIGSIIAWSFVAVCIGLWACVCMREKPLAGQPRRKYANPTPPVIKAHEPPGKRHAFRGPYR
jgi:hypothetical protein